MKELTVRKVCQGKKRDGTPCRAGATAGKDYCFNHDPDNIPETQGPLLKEILKEEIARIDGYNVLADLVISKIGRAISKDFGK